MLHNHRKRIKIIFVNWWIFLIDSIFNRFHNKILFFLIQMQSFRLNENISFFSDDALGRNFARAPDYLMWFSPQPCDTTSKGFGWSTRWRYWKYQESKYYWLRFRKVKITGFNFRLLSRNKTGIYTRLSTRKL